jgi:hypothetical protein
MLIRSNCKRNETPVAEDITVSSVVKGWTVLTLTICKSCYILTSSEK